MVKRKTKPLGWKRILNSPNVISYLKEGRRYNVRGIKMDKDEMLIIDKNTKGNYNIIIGKGSSGSRVLKKSLNSKPQALKFAKSYMKKK